MGNQAMNELLGRAGEGSSASAIPTDVTDPIAPGLEIPDAQKGDGAGEYDSEVAGLAAHAQKAVWRMVATAAAQGGMPNAGAHMHHYLDNSGSLLVLRLDDALQDDPTYQETLDRYIYQQLDIGVRGAMSAPDEAAQWGFDLTKNTEHYFESANTRDWYYAVGGHTTWCDGWYTYTPGADGTGTLTMDLNLYLFDRYNWDGTKEVELLDNTPLDNTLLDVTVTDDQLGQLHRQGVAQEFEMYGDTHRQVETQIIVPQEADEAEADGTIASEAPGDEPQSSGEPSPVPENTPASAPIEVE